MMNTAQGQGLISMLSTRCSEFKNLCLDFKDNSTGGILQHQVTLTQSNRQLKFENCYWQYSLPVSSDLVRTVASSNDAVFGDLNLNYSKFGVGEKTRLVHESFYERNFTNLVDGPTFIDHNTKSYPSCHQGVFGGPDAVFSSVAGTTVEPF